MIAVCEYCEKEYTTKHCWYKRAKHHTCSRECADKLKIKLNTKICKQCGESYHSKNHQKESKYCSVKCCSKSKIAQVYLICNTCSQEYSVNSKRQETSKFCSRKCLSQYLGSLASLRIGELNANYKGYNDERRSVKARLKTWSKAIKNRDKQCKMCNDTSCLSAHHIKPYATHPELRFEISNGILLCGKCHAEQHKNDKRKVTQLILKNYVYAEI